MSCVKKIVVIGLQNPSEPALDKAQQCLREHGWDEWSLRLGLAVALGGDDYGVDFFDKVTFPERGDALDHIDENVELVVALNICGFRGNNPVSVTVDNHYNARNRELLSVCKRAGAWLLTVGQHPTVPPEQKIEAVLYMNMQDEEWECWR